jgi:hypothetical protein
VPNSRPSAQGILHAALDRIYKLTYQFTSHTGHVLSGQVLDVALGGLDDPPHHGVGLRMDT